MTKKIEKFRDGVFALYTRRFGTVAEFMIEKMYDFEEPKNQYHDRYDRINNKRIEIKFATALISNKSKITFKNIIEQIFNASMEKRALESIDIKTQIFDANIQQIKADCFDILYYGLFFTDKVIILKASSDEVLRMPGYSNKQHKNNEGEGQFHIKPDNIDYHIKNYFEKEITYEELYTLFGGKIRQKRKKDEQDD